MGRNVSDAEQRARGRATLQELLKLLEGRDRDPGIDVDRWQEVRTRIDAAIQGFG